MNIIKSLVMAIAVLTAGSITPTAQAAKPDFSKLAGKYSATYNLVSGSTDLSGKVIVTITVPKSGSKAAIQIVGYGAATTSPGTTFSLLGNHTLTARHRITSNNIVLAYIAQIPAVPTRFGGSKNRFTFTLTSNSSVATGTMSYVMTFNGKRLLISGNGMLSGTPTTVVLKGAKKGK